VPKRLVVETSDEERRQLDAYLLSHGTSLTEWFSARVSEATAVYAVRPDLSDASTVPAYLRSPRAVLKELESLDWTFADADTGYLTHGVHPYPAKFIPQIPRALIRSLSAFGDLVWDPFGGSGTTAVEAALLGRRCVSSDVNPLSEIIGRAKTHLLERQDEAEVGRLASHLEVLARDSLSRRDFVARNAEAIEALVPDIPNTEKWFAPISITELALIRWHVDRLQTAGARAIGKCALSRIVVRVSFQDGETRYASKPRKVEDGAALRAFSAEVMSEVSRAKAFTAATVTSQSRFVTADLRHDAVLPPSAVDLVVTSPPYPNATDYHLYHRFRLLWLGFSPIELSRSEIGSHLRHQREDTGIEEYVGEMRTCLERILVALRPSCYAALVVGDGVFKGKTHSTASLLGDAAADVGFETVGYIGRDVHRTRRSFIPSARRLRHERILLLQKPASRALFLVRKPSYRLWPYEDRLRMEEIRAVTGAAEIRDTPKGAVVAMSAAEARILKGLTFSHSFESEDFAPEYTWQAVLENGDSGGARTRKDPKYAGHGIHDYKGKFYPQLAKSLLNLAQVDRQCRILDPFCGSGTVLLEAQLNGFRAFGIDLNPLAVRIAAAKCSMLDADLGAATDFAEVAISNARASAADGFVDKATDSLHLKELRAWFAEPVLCKLMALRAAIEQTPHTPVRWLLTVCLSAIVREVSQQDPKDLRIRRRKSPLNDAPVFELFAKRVEEALARQRRLRQAMPYVPWPLGAATSVQGDARSWSTFAELGLGPSSIDAVVTSPPYATALPYIDTDRLSLLLLFRMTSQERAAAEYNLTGSREITARERNAIEKLIDEDKFDSIESRTARRITRDVLALNRKGDVGFRRQNQAALLFRYYRDMSAALANIHKVVKKSASLFFVIGNNRTTAGVTEVLIDSAKTLKEMGEALGWRVERDIPITVTKEARPHHRNSITDNNIIWFRKA
jgi:DNA modification methylase